MRCILGLMWLEFLSLSSHAILHLTAMPAEDEDPKVILLRAQLDQRLGEVQLPDVILQVDAQVRFSWIMLGRKPRSTEELLMVYAGILAHGTSLTSTECAPIPD